MDVQKLQQAAWDYQNALSGWYDAEKRFGRMSDEAHAAEELVCEAKRRLLEVARDGVAYPADEEAA